MFEKPGENGLFIDDKIYISFLTEEDTDVKLYLRFGVPRQPNQSTSPTKEREPPKTLEGFKAFLKNQSKEEMPIFRLPTEILNSRISKLQFYYSELE